STPVAATARAATTRRASAPSRADQAASVRTCSRSSRFAVIHRRSAANSSSATSSTTIVVVTTPPYGSVGLDDGPRVGGDDRLVHLHHGGGHHRPVVGGD